MSYILDALNKSGQERRRRHTPPGIDALQRPTTPSPASSAPWITLLALLLIVNIAVGLWWINRDVPAVAVERAPSTPAPGTSNPLPDPPVTAEPRANAAPRPALGEGDELITPTDYHTGDNRPVAPAVSAGPDVVRMTDLPAEVQAQIPPLTFSSHIYSGDPTFRRVNINGQNLREGDTVSESVDLLAITESGVILAYRHHRFEVDAF